MGHGLEGLPSCARTHWPGLGVSGGPCVAPTVPRQHAGTKRHQPGVPAAPTPGRNVESSSEWGVGFGLLTHSGEMEALHPQELVREQ